MFTTKLSADSKAEHLNKSKTQREQREKERQYSDSVLTIQRHCRRYLSNKRLRAEYLASFRDVVDSDAYTSQELFGAFRKVLFIKRGSDSMILRSMCKKIVSSMETSSKHQWYVSVAVSKSSKEWLNQVSRIISWTLNDINHHTNVINILDKDKILVYLYLYQILCDVNSWKLYKSTKSNTIVLQLLERFSATFYSILISGGVLNTFKLLYTWNVSRMEPVLSTQHLLIISRFIFHVFKRSSFDEDIWFAMHLSVFVTPSLIGRLAPSHVTELSRDVHILNCLVSLTTNSHKIIAALSKEELLFLLLNVVNLLFESLRAHQVIRYPAIVSTIHKLLVAACKSTNKANHWHPILGFCDSPVSAQLTNSVKQLTLQISMLHSNLIKKFFFQDLLEADFPTDKVSSWKLLFSSRIQSESKLLLHVSGVCSLYNTAIKIFELHKSVFLMSLCCFPDFLYCLWKLVYTEYSQSSKNLARSMADELANDHFVPVLLLFCSCFGQYFVVLSDEEIYEQEQPFTLRELGTIADFVNSMLFNLLWNNFAEMHNPVVLERVAICHGLLVLLHERDERRKYTSGKHWTPKDASPSAILTELKASKGRAQKVADHIPWVFPNKKKIEYLHDLIKQDKALKRSEQGRTVLIKIHRKRLFEDGFRHMKLIKDSILKHHIKIMFINELGVEEAGIDQDGVFKEFLEETINHAFNPSFGLFSVTEENHWLYPSPLSKIHYEHIDLFHYIGRILAKAVYEGITIDATFAPFFTRQLLHNKNALFSYLDELPGLDSELYKNLCFIKTYEGDVQDLGLTYSVDENEFGKIVTHELMPGGSVTPVTNSNKISYVHQMAHYKMYTQIQGQIKAFVAGFRSIINDDWLRMFSLPEIQKLISGDSSEVDLSDLKRNVRYLGGYHSGHKVITWFWDILINEFDESEKRSFLKFVTSCSKPPLMGFGAMSPPFSIRAVDEDVEHNDTDVTPGQALKSSLKSFLGLHGSNECGNSRLPTASTCFNLLKLPMYRKKQVLRDKLRYAINAGAGFELS